MIPKSFWYNSGNVEKWQDRRGLLYYKWNSSIISLFFTAIITKQCHALMYSLLFQRSAVVASKVISAPLKNCLSKIIIPDEKGNCLCFTSAKGLI